MNFLKNIIHFNIFFNGKRLCFADNHDQKQEVLDASKRNC